MSFSGKRVGFFLFSAREKENVDILAILGALGLKRLHIVLAILSTL
jgi:hypothetical protein